MEENKLFGIVDFTILRIDCETARDLAITIGSVFLRFARHPEEGIRLNNFYNIFFIDLMISVHFHSFSKHRNTNPA